MLARLHVNIFDTAKTQFTIPSSVISLASGASSVHKADSDLVFNYESTPFAFWVTRTSDPDAQPLFDTRTSSLPQTPIPPVISEDASTALDAFPLIFEDQYLQLASALPLGANVYGLGEVVASSGFRRDVGTDGGPGTIQTLWARDAGDPLDQNMYVEGCPHLYAVVILILLALKAMALMPYISNIVTTKKHTDRNLMVFSCIGSYGHYI